MNVVPMEVTYVNHMGNDLEVVNAARVSFSKESDWEDYDEFPVLSEKDTKLIKYLAEHNHWSPFSHCFIKFRIKAPIFVARQLQKHTVGLAWNEVSRRYVDYEPEFWFPDEWRLRAENKKQGSSDEVLKDDFLVLQFMNSVTDSLDIYNEAIDNNVAPELARMLLPQNTMTEWIWSGSLYAFARVCNLRLGEGAQKEAGDIAGKIKEILKVFFPVSVLYLLENDNGDTTSSKA